MKFKYFNCPKCGKQLIKLNTDEERHEFFCDACGMEIEVAESEESLLIWYEENGKWLGFDDGTYVYRVAEDENGWYYEYLPDADGMDGYDTAEEAMAEAEKDCEAHNFEIDWEDLEPLDLEDLEDAYWDAVAHERMEITKGLL